VETLNAPQLDCLERGVVVVIAAAAAAAVVAVISEVVVVVEVSAGLGFGTVCGMGAGGGVG
jgi:hypothetical protein